MTLLLSACGPQKHFLDTAEKNLKTRVQALPDPGSKALRFIHEPLEVILTTSISSLAAVPHISVFRWPE